MTKTIIHCDVCNQEAKDTTKMQIPIIAHKGNTNYMTLKEMDVCILCANRFMRLYYTIAEEHHYSGVYAFYERGDNE